MRNASDGFYLYNHRYVPSTACRVFPGEITSLGHLELMYITHYIKKKNVHYSLTIT
jgi:hypothetical protein